MAKKEEIKVRTYRDVLADLRRFAEDNGVMDEPFDGYGYVQIDKKIGNKTRTRHLDIGTGYLTLSESMMCKY